MSEAVSAFVRELSLHFSKRHDNEADEDAWLESMSRNLRGYKADVIRRAGQKIIDSRKERFFPLPAECKAVCEEIARFDDAEKTPRLTAYEANFKNYDWQYKLADDLVMCELGRTAAREGWVLSLHDFCRNNGRLPKDFEINKCKQAAKGFDEAYEAVLRGEGGMAGKQLEALGGSMLARREAIRNRVLGVRG